MPTAFAVFPHGVIGNTTVFGTVILGSSPGGEAFLVFLPAAAKAFELGFLRNRGLRVKMCVWLGVSRGLDLAFLNAD